MMKQMVLATALFVASITGSGTVLSATQNTQGPTRVERGAAVTVRTGDWVPTRGQERRRSDRGGRGVGAVLYSNPDFGGARYLVEGNYMRNLGNTGFNDRAQSLHVARGYWIFCSDADFQGECRTFGPGDYRRLPRALDNKISSGRRISERYPYSGRPNWER
jgi:hypothetical protein